MLHILLLILKIIGIIIAVLLGLLLLVVLVVLFVPIRYRFEGKKYSDIVVRGKVTWAFGLVHLRVLYLQEKLSIVLRIAGYRFYDNDDSNKKEKKEKKSKKKNSKKKKQRSDDESLVTEKDSSKNNNELSDKEEVLSDKDKVLSDKEKVLSDKEKISSDKEKESNNTKKELFETEGKSITRNESIDNNIELRVPIKETDVPSDKEQKNQLLEDKSIESKQLSKETKDKEIEDKETEDKETEDKEIEDKEIEDKEIEDREIEDKKLEDKKLETDLPEADSDLESKDILTKDKLSNLSEDSSNILRSLNTIDEIEKVSSSDSDKNANENTRKKISFLRRFISKIKQVCGKIKKFFVSIWNKIKNLKNIFHKLKAKLSSIRNLLQGLWEKKRKVVSYFKLDENKAGIKLGLASIKKLLKHIRPTKAKGYIHYGTGDPASTGQIFGVAAAFYGYYGKYLKVVPDFEEEVLEGELFIKGRIRLFNLLIIGIKLLRDKNFKRLIKNTKLLKEELL